MIKNAGQLVALAPEEAAEQPWRQLVSNCYERAECAQLSVLLFGRGLDTGSLVKAPAHLPRRPYGHMYMGKHEKEIRDVLRTTSGVVGGMSKADKASFRDCLVS